MTWHSTSCLNATLCLNARAQLRQQASDNVLGARCWDIGRHLSPKFWAKCARVVAVGAVMSANSSGWATPAIILSSAETTITETNLTSLGSGNITSSSGTPNLTINLTTANETISGIISSPIQNLTLTGTKILTLSGVNTYTGSTTISSGTLQIGSGSTTGSIASASIVNNAALVFNRSTNSSYTGVISGSGTVTQNGTGTLTLSGTNTYTGGTTISAGTLKILAANKIGTGTLTLNGGTLQAGAAFTLSQAITLTANSTVDPNGFALTLSNQITANGYTLTIGGTSGGTVTYNGLVQSGTVTTTSPLSWTTTTASLSTPYNTAVTTGTLPAASGGVTPYTYSVLNASSSVVTPSSGAYALTHGSLTISGSNFTYAPTAGYSGSDSFTYHVADSGSSTLSETFTLTVAALGNLSGANLTLTEADASNFSNAISNTGTASTLTINLTTTNEVLSSTITESTHPIALIKTGNNTLTLAADNAYTGGTTVSAGVLEINHVTGTVVDALGTTSGGSNILIMADGTTLQCGSVLAAANATSSSLPLPIQYAGSVTINTSDGSASHALSTTSGITCTATSGTNQINVTGGGVYTPAAAYTASSGGTDILNITGTGTTLSVSDATYIPTTVHLNAGTIVQVTGNVTLPTLILG